MKILSKLKYISLFVSKLLFTLVSLFLFMASIAGISILSSIMGEQFHLDALRYIDGGSVVHILAGNGTPKKPFQWHGTGFYVKSPSGKTVVVTNRHVCLGGLFGEPAKYVSIRVDGKSTPAMTKVIKVATNTDLCMLEPTILGVAPLNLADNIEVGQLVYTIGHPHGQPLTVTKGETVGTQEIKIQIQLHNSRQAKACVKYKNNKAVKAESFFGTIKICENTVSSAITTSIIKGGSSGSPAVNVFGNVVGVMFASESQGVSWGFMVPLKHLEQFLKDL